MGKKNPIYPGYWYFLTLTVVDWVDIFTRPVYKDIIIDSLEFCQKKKGLEIGAWCLMTNHLHLIATSGTENSLSSILRDFKHFTATEILKEIPTHDESRKDWLLHRFKFASHFDPKRENYKFWQTGNEPKEIHTNEFLDQKLDYIHNNPVVAQIVDEPEHYLHSSARDSAGMNGLLKITFLD